MGSPLPGVLPGLPPGEVCSPVGVGRQREAEVALGDQRRRRAHPGALPGAGLILPLREKKAGGGEGGGHHILWSPFPGTVCAQAGLAAARALQNSDPVESVPFGKVHFAQEPRKTEDCSRHAEVQSQP